MIVVKWVPDPSKSCRLPDLEEFTGDSKLDRRIDRVLRTILARLELTSEQRAHPIAGDGSGHGKPESRAPINLDVIDEEPADPKRPPHKQRSAHDFYAWHFRNLRRLPDTRKRLRLAHVYLFLAERDLMDVILGAEDRNVERIDGRRVRRTTEQIDDELLGYQGVESLAVSLITGHSPVVVETFRRRRKLDRLGYRMEDEGSPADRRDRARQIKREHPHLSTRQIAARMGVSHMAIQRYLQDDEPAREAA